jgi:glycosyltransferase involved in cell wall biosynthesis
MEATIHAAEQEPATVVCVIPAFNAERVICRAVRSALRQQQVAIRVVVVDHGSEDGTAASLTSLCSNDKRLTLIRLKRRPDELASASRPLNEGITAALDQVSDDSNTWFIRLDADDFLSGDFALHTALTEGARFPLIMGLLTFYNRHNKPALVYGPRLNYRTRDALRAGGAYATAHHATLIRADLLKRIQHHDGYFYYERISYGEDLDFTMRLLRMVQDEDLRFVEKSLLFKFSGEGTISNTATIRTIWRDMSIVFDRSPELPRRLLHRLAIDLLLRNRGHALERLRKLWGFPAGQFGFEDPVDPAPANARLTELMVS